MESNTNESIDLLKKLNQISKGNESPCDCLKDIFKQRILIAKRYLSCNDERQKQICLDMLEHCNKHIKEALSI